MSGTNIVVLQGRLTKQATCNSLSNGQSVVTLSVAVNKDFLNRQTNEWASKTYFFDVTWWGDRAKNRLADFTKGREVLIEGELKTSTWEKDGKKYSRVEINANRVQALRRPGEGKSAAAQNGQNGQNAQNPPEAPDFQNNAQANPPEQNPDEIEDIPF